MYTATGRLETDAMLKQYSPLVRRLAHQMIAKLPANVELDDLVQAGVFGQVGGAEHPARPRGEHGQDQGGVVGELGDAEHGGRGSKTYRNCTVSGARSQARGSARSRDARQLVDPGTHPACVIRRQAEVLVDLAVV